MYEKIKILVRQVYVKFAYLNLLQSYNCNNNQMLGIIDNHVITRVFVFTEFLYC